MRDPREMSMVEREAALAELTPEAQHRMRPVPAEVLELDRVQPRDIVAAVEARVPSRVAARDEPCADPDNCDLPGHGPRYTAPVPPPVELGFDLVKWNQMSRVERRAVLRYAKKRGK